MNHLKGLIEKTTEENCFPTTIIKGKGRSWIKKKRLGNILEMIGHLI